MQICADFMAAIVSQGMVQSISVLDSIVADPYMQLRYSQYGQQTYILAQSLVEEQPPINTQVCRPSNLSSDSFPADDGVRTPKHWNKEFKKAFN